MELANDLSTVCCSRIMPDGDKAVHGHVRQHSPRTDDDARADVQRRVHDRGPRVSTGAARRLVAAIQARGALWVAWEADISGLDPHLSFGTQARHVVGNLFNSPVTIDAELRIVPDLA